MEFWWRIQAQRTNVVTIAKSPPTTTTVVRLPSNFIFGYLKWFRTVKKKTLKILTFIFWLISGGCPALTLEIVPHCDPRPKEAVHSCISTGNLLQSAGREQVAWYNYDHLQKIFCPDGLVYLHSRFCRFVLLSFCKNRFCLRQFVKNLNSMEWRDFYDIFASPRWSQLRMRAKVVSFLILIFSKTFQTKKMKELRQKIPKIASREGSCPKPQQEQENQTRQQLASLTAPPAVIFIASSIPRLFKETKKGQLIRKIFCTIA